MGLFSWTVGLPLAPVRAVIGLGQVIQRQAETQQRDPAAVRRRLEELDEAQRSGRLGAEDVRREQSAVTTAMLRPAPGRDAEREREEGG
ncbi:gas vesicle protein GvpG [Actinocrinis puniceicyclus]|uniref:Gas vesicle protein GvpG n=1 Tax=Actinocrinis puniceicyclus TaxID=977794 RepID=A0A8J7WSN8_9ACTN|nr:gas vesicle protein GvpG [Actinocrinis puniceicyclus]MBS2964935.1 gas vesicle protein GvpG [Actinocrinis puniceicyclus]